MRNSWPSKRLIVAAAIVLAAWVSWWGTSSVHREVNRPAPQSQITTADTNAITTAVKDSGGLETPSKPNSPDEILRSPAPARLRVVSNTGEPIEGACAAWTPLAASWLDQATLWPDLDWTQLERASRNFISDSDGVVVVEGLPREQVNGGSVLWLTHPQHVAASVQLDFPSAELVLPAEVLLQPSDGLSVRVIGPDGEPAVGAGIVMLADLSRDDAYIDGDNRRQFEYVFRRTAITDDRGMAVLDPFPKEQYVYAILEGRRSEPWLGLAPAKIVLDLRPTASVSGTVHLDAGTPYEPDMRVKCSIRRGYDEVVFDRARVRPDGTWGSVPLPIVGCDSYAFRLRGGTVAEDQVFIPIPRPGEALTVDFHPKAGIEIPVRIVEGTGQGLADATVSVHWNVDGVWHSVGAKTNPEGIARFRNCLPGRIWIRARRSGFTPKMVGDYEVSAQPAEPVTLQLERAGQVRGHCMHAGTPVKDFTVLFWRGEPDNQEKLVVKDSADGSFLIEEAPLGEVILVATSDDCPRSEPVKAMVVAEQPSEVMLEFPSLIAGKGRIVDGLSGAPVTDATVQVLVTYSTKNALLRPWKTAERVDSQGEFQLRGFVSGENVIEISAAGYATSQVRRHGVPDQLLDFGVLTLFAKQSVEVQFVSQKPIDWSQYRVSLDGTRYIADQSVPIDGVIRYTGLDPGQYALRIVFPVENARYEDFTLQPGQNLHLDIPMHTRPITIEVIPELGAEEPQWYYLKVNFASLRGRSTEQIYMVPESRRLDIDGITGAAMIVKIVDVQARPLAVQHVPLEPTWPSVVQIHVSKSPLTFRVLDDSRVPIPGVRIILTSPNNSAWWTEQLETDAAGESTANGFAFDRIYVALYHPAYGLRPSELVEALRGDRAPIELTLAPKYYLRVALLDGTAPVVGLQVLATDHRGIGWGLASGYTDDNSIAIWGPVSAGDFKVEVQHPGYWPTEQLIHLSGDGNPIPMQVRRLGNVDLAVKNNYGNPATNVAIDLNSLEQGQWVSTWIQSGLVPTPTSGLVTGEDGHVRIQGLPNGEFRWRATSPNGGIVEGTVQVPPNGTAQVQVTAP